MRFYLISTAVFLWISSAHAVEVATRLAAKDIQMAEEIVAAAVSTGDVAELKRQSRRLPGVAGRIPEVEDMGIRVSCTSAASSLGTAAEDLARVGEARWVVSARRNLRLYAEAMQACEEYTGLPPLQGTGLRTH